MSHSHAIAADDSPVTAVIDAVADGTDRSPLAMPPLSQAVDPDALDALLSTGDQQIEVSFEYLGHEVVATSDEVRVRATVDE